MSKNLVVQICCFVHFSVPVSGPWSTYNPQQTGKKKGEKGWLQSLVRPLWRAAGSGAKASPLAARPDTCGSSPPCLQQSQWVKTQDKTVGKKRHPDRQRRHPDHQTHGQTITWLNASLSWLVVFSDAVIPRPFEVTFCGVPSKCSGCVQSATSCLWAFLWVEPRASSRDLQAIGWVCAIRRGLRCCCLSFWARERGVCTCVKQCAWREGARGC